jgi:paraquat-inducible protein A
MINSKHIACHECDLLVQLTHLAEGCKAICPRCGYTLTANHRNARDRVIAFSLTALVFLGLSFVFPFLTFSAQGQDRTTTLMQSISVMITEDFTSLAAIIFITIIVIPALYLFSAIYVYVSLKSARLLPGTHATMKLIGYLKNWSMADIFLIGILISFIKIMSLADVSLGLSFWSYVFFIISMTAAVLHIDRHQVWQWIKQKEKLPVTPVPKSGIHQGCHVCTELADASKEICSTCGAHLHLRIKNSVQKTWALLITAVFLYLPANMLPIMRTNFFGEETTNTILGGVLVLWEHGSYPIALIIFIASVMVPVGKIIALGWLCYSVQTQSQKSYQQKTQLFRVTELVGRWSMVDVFVVAILVALIKLGNIMSIYPGWGALAFAGMVIVTVMAALSFDPRLIWDSINKKKD